MECKAKAIYSCNKGYEVEGPKERRCDETGQWTGTTPKCKSKIKVNHIANTFINQLSYL